MATEDHKRGTYVAMRMARMRPALATAKVALEEARDVAAGHGPAGGARPAPENPELVAALEAMAEALDGLMDDATLIGHETWLHGIAALEA